MKAHEAQQLIDAIDEFGTPISHQEQTILENIQRISARGDALPLHYARTLESMYRKISSRAMQ